MLGYTRLFILGVFAFASAAVAMPAAWNLGARAASGALVPGQTRIEAHGPSHYGINADGTRMNGVYVLHVLTPPAALGLKRAFLTVDGADNTLGHAAIRHHSAAPYFFISPRDAQLYQLVNATTVFHVNVLNMTMSAAQGADGLVTLSAGSLPLASSTRQAPHRLALGAKKEGVTGGRWRSVPYVWEPHVRDADDGRPQMAGPNAPLRDGRL
jgi:hypothetical protein